VQIRVYYEDTDAGGIVYHSQYLNFCERARSEIFFSKNIEFNENSYFIVKSLKADYISSAKLGDILEIKTNLISKKRTSVVLEQKIYKEEKEIFVLEVVLVYLSKDKILKIPIEYLELF
jgi:acyl-CoA thioester hydrolase